MLVDLMRLPNNIKGIQWARNTIFDVLENALLPLSDSVKLDGQRGPNLIVNYVCLILMAFIKNGLIECLIEVGMRSDMELAPRARTLLQRIQFLSAKYLPSHLCEQITNIEKVMSDATKFNVDDFDVKLARIRKRKKPHKCEYCHCELHALALNKNANKNYKANLQITVQRNFANMMISELTEDAPMDMDNDNNNQHLAAAHQHHINQLGGDDNDDDENDMTDQSMSSMSLSNLSVKDTHISLQTICHRLGPEFDLNSTFIRYRYMMDRDIPAMMFQDRIPFHAHRIDDENQYFNVDSNFEQFSFKSQKRNILECLKFDQNASYSESVILNMLKRTQVILSKDFMLWNMDYVWKVLNGPLWDPSNLQVALTKTKFIKRLVQYLRPSRMFFSQLKWNITTIRHAQCACQLFRLLIASDEGVKHQYFQELIQELFDHLKDQIEANLKRKRTNLPQTPFSRQSMRYTLSRVYIILIGILSESQRGIKFFSQHQMLAFLFRLTRKEITDHSMKKNRLCGPNDYLLRLLATNLDYTVSDDFRMLFSQWMVSGSYYLRKCLIGHLDLLYRAQMPKFDEWSINVLSVLLKDKEQRLALAALKVLEKINLSQHSIKSTQYLIDLIYTQPTDSIIGIYGQFLFIKMLSTKQGLAFLQSTGWLNDKRNQWTDFFHTRYTNMLETALAHSVSSTFSQTQQSHFGGQQQSAENDEEKANNKNAKGIERNKEEDNQLEMDWLPYHLIHENRSDEEELYAEYLTQFPWSMTISVVKASGTEIDVVTDCFFDYNCFYYKNRERNKYPISLGPGIHAIILDKNGCPKPLHIDKSSRIKIKLNIGHETLDDLYNVKRSLSKTVSMIEAYEYKSCSIIHEDQSYFFFEANSGSATDSNPEIHGKDGQGHKHNCLTRVFWSLKEIKKAHSLVRPLPLFYGELCKTQEGCRYVVETKLFLNDVKKFVFTVHDAYLDMVKLQKRQKRKKQSQKHGDIDIKYDDDDDDEHANRDRAGFQRQKSNLFAIEEDDDYERLKNADSNNLELRSSLWALGMIGSSTTGLALLNNESYKFADSKRNELISIIDDICRLSLKSPTLSIRGTCLYVLGLLSRTQAGMDQLMRFGFDFPADNLELDLGVAIPVNIDEFFKLGECDFMQSDDLSNLSVSCHSPPTLCRPSNMKPLDPNELLTG